MLHGNRDISVSLQNRIFFSGGFVILENGIWWDTFSSLFKNDEVVNENDVKA